MLYLSGKSLFTIWIVGLVVSFYSAWEIFVSGSNPSKVTIDDYSITFTSYGKDHRYEWNEINKLQVKEFIGARKLFVRINDPGFLKGRYWVNCYYSNDTDELYKYIVDREYNLHPNTLKSQARANGEKDLAERKRKAQAKKDEVARRQAEAAKRRREILAEIEAEKNQEES